jgi:hypothetical protein
LKGEDIMNKIKKISWLFAISLASITFLVGVASANKEVFTLQGNDVSGSEIRAITLESWDCDRGEGAKHGWDLITDKDSDYPKLSQYGNKDDKKYEPELAASSQAFRRVKLVDGKPRNLKSKYGKFGKDSESKEKILALKYQFTYPGYHEVTVRPPQVDHYKIIRERSFIRENDLDREDYKKQPETRKPKRQTYEIYGIELPGKAKGLSMWVLGRGNQYSLEAWLEDWKGETHIVKFGSLDFVGWRPVSAAIPSSIPQDINSYPQAKTLVFKQFKLRSNPRTNGEMVYLFFDEFKVLTDVFDVHFDGSEISFDDEDKKAKLKTDKMLERLDKAAKCEPLPKDDSSSNDAGGSSDSKPTE